MNIDTRQIPAEGVIVREELPAQKLDVSTDVVDVRRPVSVTAAISRISNALTVDLAIEGHVKMVCSRCLTDIEKDFRKQLRLNYPIDKDNPIISLDDDIREEIILEYPINPLCKPDCLGLCPRCGSNVNEGPCHCGP